MLPTPDVRLQVSSRILDRRLVPRGDKLIAQVLIKWRCSPESMATWEDQELLKQTFSRAPAWGQAVFRPGKIVSSTGTTTAEIDEMLQEDPASERRSRPKRNKQVPTRVAGPEWAQ